MSEPTVVECPHCGKPVPWTDVSKWKPFCSERCRLIAGGVGLGEKTAPPTEEPRDQGVSESGAIPQGERRAAMPGAPSSRAVCGPLRPSPPMAYTGTGL